MWVGSEAFMTSFIDFGVDSFVFKSLQLVVGVDVRCVLCGVWCVESGALCLLRCVE